MAVSPNLEKHWSENRPARPSKEILASLDKFGLFGEYRKQVEFLLATERKEDALHPDVQEAIVSGYNKVQGITDIHDSIYSAVA